MGRDCVWLWVYTCAYVRVCARARACVRVWRVWLWEIEKPCRCANWVVLYSCSTFVISMCCIHCHCTCIIALSLVSASFVSKWASMHSKCIKKKNGKKNAAAAPVFANLMSSHYLAPDALNSSAHLSGLKNSAVNSSAKSGYVHPGS